jgi:hypothetical protein
MYHDDQPDVPRYAQDPTFLGARGLRLPGDCLSLKLLSGQPTKAPYNNIPGILINVLCALVDPPGSLVGTLLYRCLSNILDRSRGGVHDKYLVVRDGIT